MKMPRKIKINTKKITPKMRTAQKMDKKNPKIRKPKENEDAPIIKDNLKIDSTP